MYSMNVYSQQQMQQQGQSQVLRLFACWPAGTHVRQTFILLIFRLARYGPAFFV